MNKKTVKTILAIILTAVLVWLLSSQVNLVETFGLIKSLPLQILLASFGLYILGHIGRAVRFYRLLGWKTGFHELFSIVCLHNLFINTLPARTGEVSYLYMTQKRDVPLTKAGSVLVIARVLDMISISLILVFAVSFTESLPAVLTAFSQWIIILLLVCLFFLFMAVYFGTNVIEVLQKVSGKFKFGESKKVQWLLEKGMEIAESFTVLKSRWKFLEHLSYSLFIWGVRFVLFWLILFGLGIEIGIWLGIIGITLPMISTFLPIQGLGVFGTFEGVFAGSFILLGVATQTAILSGFAFHIVFLTYAIVMGLYGFVVLTLVPKLKKN